MQIGEPAICYGECKGDGNDGTTGDRKKVFFALRFHLSFYFWSVVLFVVIGTTGGETMAKVEKESVKFKTSDHFSIAGDFYLDPKTRNSVLPCVVLVHQFYHNKEQWGTFPDELVSRGNRVLAYDIRGHGASDRVKDMTSLLSDPQQAPFDFDGALEWMSGVKGINKDKIAVVGTSIGGYIACMANAIYPERVKTAVAVSSSKKGVLAFLRHKAGDHRMRSVLYVAAAGDGTHAEDARELAASYTDDPKKVQIYDDVSEHGIELLNRRPEIGKVIVDWLEEGLK